MLERECEILYVGTKRGLEADIVPKENIAFRTVDICGFQRKLSVENLKTVLKSARGVWQARKIIRDFKPDVVIGTGGYVCGPILLAASLMGIKTLVQEQNVIAGITNKILAHFATRIAIGCAEARKNFPAKKTVFTGNPIRPEVMTATRDEAKAAYGLDGAKKTILISGGSRGARSINRAMVDVHAHYANSDKVQLLHVTGKNEYNDIISRLEKCGINAQNAPNIIIKPYLYDMPKALAAADLAIFRAGATGIAELTAKGIPSILVPYPYAAENHQEFNALALKKKGAAVVILDRELTKERLIGAIDEIILSEKRLADMKKASLSLGKPEAAREIAALAIAMAKNEEY
jgi:UDP-N-acetylglucosamine--N-acetylmuramyl-(pentapeptide) pyrophosphoryl-undecaprenol N-acetylglucosamine transferase